MLPHTAGVIDLAGSFVGASRSNHSIALISDVCIHIVCLNFKFKTETKANVQFGW